MRVGALVLTLAVSLAAGGCGSQEPSPPPPPTGGTDGGGDGAGGSGGGGTDGGAAGPQGGSGSGGDPGGAGGSSGAGSGGGASGDGGSAGGGGGGAGGGTAGPCDGMMPAALGAPVVVELDGSFCSSATSHPSGVVALSAARVVDGSGEGRLPYAPSGLPAGSPMRSLSTSGSDVDTYFHPVTNGFRGIVLLRPTPGVLDFRLRTWDLSGGLVRDLPLPVRSIAPLPDGGSVLVFLNPASPPGANPLLAWMDAAGVVTRTVPLDDDVSRVIVNWPTGHVFAFIGGTSGRATQGRWYDGAGAPLTPWFVLPLTKGSGHHQRLLADGVVVLGNTGTWLTAVRDGVAGTEDVPPWLAARPGMRIVNVRGGRGHALLPVIGTGAFEIVTTTGESCGTVTVPPPSFGAATDSPPPAWLDVGWDGTVFETFQLLGPGSAGPPRCVFRWWPRALE